MQEARPSTGVVLRTRRLKFAKYILLAQLLPPLASKSGISGRDLMDGLREIYLLEVVADMESIHAEG